MGYFKQQRLDCSRHLLISPVCQHLNIIESVMRSGFNNLAHLSRVFLYKYDASPRDYLMQK